MNTSVWKQTDEGREEKTWKGWYHEETPLDCVNALLYEIRGEKSDWELAYVNEVRPAERTEDTDQ